MSNKLLQLESLVLSGIKSSKDTVMENYGDELKRVITAINSVSSAMKGSSVGQTKSGILVDAGEKMGIISSSQAEKIYSILGIER